MSKSFLLLFVLLNSIQLLQASVEKYTNHLALMAATIAKEQQHPFSASHMPLNIRYIKGTNHPVDPRLEVRWISNLKGYGVFAKTDIPAGTVISEYTGDTSFENKKKLMDPNVNSYVFILDVGILNNNMYCLSTQFNSPSLKFFVIDSLNGGNEMRFVNHSSNNFNLRPKMSGTEFVDLNAKGPSDLVALVWLPREEVFVEYGKEALEVSDQDPSCIRVHFGSKIKRCQRVNKITGSEIPLLTYCLKQTPILSFQTTRLIRANEELTVNYGESYWTVRGITPIA